MKTSSPDEMESAAREYLKGFSWGITPGGAVVLHGRKLADWLGLSRQQLKTVTPWKMVFGPDRQRHREKFLQAEYLREPFSTWVRMFRHDGELFWTNWEGAPGYSGVTFLGYGMCVCPGDVARELYPHRPEVVRLGLPIRSVSLAST